MRRVPAILLVVLFSYSLMAPALLVDDESNLPACCRRDGKHHCGMMAQDMAGTEPAPSSGPAADALRAKCPFFPNGGATLPHSGTALLAAAQTSGISIAIRTSTPARSEAGYRLSFDRSHPKRGPPTLLS
jgi:hypothetical protein